MERLIENNQVTISGTITEELKLSHTIFGEGFYTSYISSDRTRGTADVIPIMVSERLIAVDDVWTGQNVRISGQFRSYNKRDAVRNKLILSVFVRELEVVEDDAYNENEIILEGFICKEPNYRTTPLGREITDFLLAVNRPYGKSDYIPCIAWGRNAKYVSDMNVGNMVHIEGRIQSREYIKRFEDGTTEQRICYEVSAGRVEIPYGDDK